MSLSATDMSSEPLFSDAHPGYVGNDDEDVVSKPSGLEGDTAFEDTPAAAEVTAPAQGLITSDYFLKSVIVMVIIVAIVLIMRRRRRNQDSRFNDKSDV